MAAPDAEVGGADVYQRANRVMRNMSGSPLEDAFKDKLRKMISVRTPPPVLNCLVRLTVPPPPLPQRNEARVIIDLGEVLQQDPQLHRNFLDHPRDHVSSLIPPFFFRIWADQAVGACLGKDC